MAALKGWKEEIGVGVVRRTTAPPRSITFRDHVLTSRRQPQRYLLSSGSLARSREQRALSRPNAKVVHQVRRVSLCTLAAPPQCQPLAAIVWEAAPALASSRPQPSSQCRPV